MDRDAFDQSLKAFVRRDPSHTFVVELAGGVRIEVIDPEALAFGGGVAGHFNRDGTLRFFDYLKVAQMIGSGDDNTSA